MPISKNILTNKECNFSVSEVKNIFIFIGQFSIFLNTASKLYQLGMLWLQVSKYLVIRVA